jgi:hypothetical protein
MLPSSSKKVRKTFIPTGLLTPFDVSYFKTDENVPSKSNKHKTSKTLRFFR